jgi:hypothetical protein
MLDVSKANKDFKTKKRKGVGEKDTEINGSTMRSDNDNGLIPLKTHSLCQILS